MLSSICSRLYTPRPVCISTTPTHLPTTVSVTTSFTYNTTLGGIRHATKKAGGSSNNTQDSAGRRLGLKISGGAHCQSGSILVRQRGTDCHPGINVYMGKDHTIHSAANGTVHFSYIFRNGRNHNKWRKFINVLTAEQTPAELEAHSAEEQAKLNKLLSDKKNKTLPKTSRQLYLDSVVEAKRVEYKQKEAQLMQEYVQRVGMAGQQPSSAQKAAE